MMMMTERMPVPVGEIITLIAADQMPTRWAITEAELRTPVEAHDEPYGRDIVRDQTRTPELRLTLVKVSG